VKITQLVNNLVRVVDMNVFGYIGAMKAALKSVIVSYV